MITNEFQIIFSHRHRRVFKFIRLRDRTGLMALAVSISSIENRVNIKQLHQYMKLDIIIL